MSLTTSIQWCHSTVNPVMGCGGCELFPAPGVVIRAIEDAFRKVGPEGGPDPKFLLTAMIGLLQRGEGSGCATEMLTSHIFDVRKIFARQIENIYGPEAGAAVQEAIETSIVCYAGKDHAKKGASIANPDRLPKKGFAERFEVVTRFPGRMAEVARASDLRGKPDLQRPWMAGLPRLIFVSDMGDAFSRKEDFDFLEQEVRESIMSEKGMNHLWLWLTKRPRRMAEFSRQIGGFSSNVCAMTSITGPESLGRIEELRKVQAPAKGLSIEPLRERLPVESLNLEGIDWVIVGGASGSKSTAGPFDVAWALQLHDHCRSNGVAFFLKQLGRNPTTNGQPLTLMDSHGGDWDEWPLGLRVREFPPYFYMFRQDEAVYVGALCSREEKEKLQQDEAEDFNRLHGLVSEHAKSQIEVSKALREIRDRKLYRADYCTFEDYCQQSLGFSRQYVNNLIRAGNTLAEMETIVSMAGAPLPSNESQLRELARVQDAEERCRHYLDLCEKVQQDGGEVTARRIREHLDGIAKGNDVVQDSAPLTPKQRIKEALVVLGELENEIGGDAKAVELLARLKKLLGD